MATKYVNYITDGSNNYYFIDNQSGYTKNTGTVTGVTIKGTAPISVDSTAAITTSGTRTISVATANGSTAGVVSGSAQSFAGLKTFTSGAVINNYAQIGSSAKLTPVTGGLDIVIIS